MKLSIGEIAGILGADLSAGDTRISDNAVIRHLLTDSRSLETPDDTLFFAIPTKGNDGHRFIPDLYARGVRSFVVNSIPSQLKDATDANFLIVSDTITALQKTAARRPDFSGHLLAITGSRGKTTLKEWIFQLMEPLSDITRSPRSYNSQIGVPLSMWELDPTTALGIIEAGISRPGEMRSLAACIRPDTVIITNIGDAHSEGFFSNAEKAAEKAILASTDTTRTVIFRSDYELIRAAVKAAAPGAATLTWSTVDPAADIYIQTENRSDGICLTYTYEGRTDTLTAPLDNETDIENAANALALQGCPPRNDS